MFAVDTTTKKITLHRGDTGVVPFRLTGYTFSENDRVLFVAKDRNGTEIIREVYPIVNNGFKVRFPNSLTDYLPAGQYEYDARVAILPIYDENQNIVDVDFDHGGMVNTPGSPFIIEILSTVGQI